MIKHVVMWRFKTEAEGRTKLENMEELKRQLLALVPLIPQIKKMEVGFDITHSEFSADFMLSTEFESVEDLKIYAVHPDHLKVSGFVVNVVESKIVFDCEI